MTSQVVGREEDAAIRQSKKLKYTKIFRIASSSSAIKLHCHPEFRQTLSLRGFGENEGSPSC